MNRFVTLLTAPVLLAMVAGPFNIVNAAPPILTTLYTFAGGTNDGSAPQSGTVFKDGVIYGTTRYGGITAGPDCAYAGCGIVWSLSPPASPGGAWTEQVLHYFAGAGDGAGPTSGLSIDSNGVLYGTTLGGGASRLGTVYSLTPPSSPGGAWTEQVLYSFSAIWEANPDAPPVIAPNGVLLGTTVGATVYSLTPPTLPGGAWTRRTIADLSGMGIPTTLVAMNGVLYGTINNEVSFFARSTQPAYPNGAVYSLTSNGDGTWSLAIIYAFGNSAADGFAPQSLVKGPGGVLYGATVGGFTGQCLDNCAGTVFSLTPPAAAGGLWTQQLLYAFESPAFGGVGPPDALELANSSGALLGSTMGNSDKQGYVYLLTPPSTPGGAWNKQTLYNFKGGSDGGWPMSVMLAGRVIYGVTLGQNTAAPNGTVFALTP